MKVKRSNQVTLSKYQMALCYMLLLSITCLPVTYATTACGGIENTYVCDDTDPAVFHMCIGEHVYTKVCPGSLHFNPKTQNCDWPLTPHCPRQKLLHSNAVHSYTGNPYLNLRPTEAFPERQPKQTREYSNFVSEQKEWDVQVPYRYVNTRSMPSDTVAYNSYYHPREAAERKSHYSNQRSYIPSNEYNINPRDEESNLISSDRYESYDYETAAASSQHIPQQSPRDYTKTSSQNFHASFSRDLESPLTSPKVLNNKPTTKEKQTEVSKYNRPESSRSRPGTQELSQWLNNQHETLFSKPHHYQVLNTREQSLTEKSFNYEPELKGNVEASPYLISELVKKRHSIKTQPSPPLDRNDRNSKFHSQRYLIEHTNGTTRQSQASILRSHPQIPYPDLRTLHSLYFPKPSENKRPDQLWFSKIMESSRRENETKHRRQRFNKVSSKPEPTVVQTQLLRTQQHIVPYRASPGNRDTGAQKPSNNIISRPTITRTTTLNRYGPQKYWFDQRAQIGTSAPRSPFNPKTYSQILGIPEDRFQGRQVSRSRASAVAMNSVYSKPQVMWYDLKDTRTNNKKHTMNDETESRYPFKSELGKQPKHAHLENNNFKEEPLRNGRFQQPSLEVNQIKEQVIQSRISHQSHQSTDAMRQNDHRKVPTHTDIVRRHETHSVDDRFYPFTQNLPVPNNPTSRKSNNPQHNVVVESRARDIAEPFLSKLDTSRSKDLWYRKHISLAAPAAKSKPEDNESSWQRQKKAMTKSSRHLQQKSSSKTHLQTPLQSKSYSRKPWWAVNQNSINKDNSYREFYQTPKSTTKKQPLSHRSNREHREAFQWATFKKENSSPRVTYRSNTQDTHLETSRPHLDHSRHHVQELLHSARSPQRSSAGVDTPRPHLDHSHQPIQQSLHNARSPQRSSARVDTSRPRNGAQSRQSPRARQSKRTRRRHGPYIPGVRPVNAAASRGKVSTYKSDVPKYSTKQGKCSQEWCRLPNCRCVGTDIPGDLDPKEVPQMVMLTFDDGVNGQSMKYYRDIFNGSLRNPNGCTAKGTFFVSGDSTTYPQVRQLFKGGHEIASHTMSHRSPTTWWAKAGYDNWQTEVVGMRDMLAQKAGVPVSEINGMRAPFLQIGADDQYKMLVDHKFRYDSSMVTGDLRPSNQAPIWPFTLDTPPDSRTCNLSPCPTRSYPGLWEVPLIRWYGSNNFACAMPDACITGFSEKEIYKYLMNNFDRHYKTNKAPLGIFLHASWFRRKTGNFGALVNFLHTIAKNGDVWIVTVNQALDWIQRPLRLSALDVLESWQC